MEADDHHPCSFIGRSYVRRSDDDADRDGDADTDPGVDASIWMVMVRVDRLCGR